MQPLSASEIAWLWLPAYGRVLVRSGLPLLSHHFSALGATSSLTTYMVVNIFCLRKQARVNSGPTSGLSVLLSRFLTTSTGVESDIVAMVVLGFRQRASGGISRGLEGGASEAHILSHWSRQLGGGLGRPALAIRRHSFPICDVYIFF